MEHKTLSQLESAAETTPIPRSRAERLHHWAEALARMGATPLNTLYQTEYAAPEAMARLRADFSPLSVASADPVLKMAGLKNDTFGEAMRFFELSEHELHRVVCYCLYGEKISGDHAADRVRGVASKRSWFGLGW